MTTSTAVVTEIQLNDEELVTLQKARNLLENIYSVLFNEQSGVRENIETGECFEKEEFMRMNSIIDGLLYDQYTSWETITDYQNIG